MGRRVGGIDHCHRFRGAAGGGGGGWVGNERQKLNRPKQDLNSGLLECCCPKCLVVVSSGPSHSINSLVFIFFFIYLLHLPLGHHIGGGHHKEMPYEREFYTKTGMCECLCIDRQTHAGRQMGKQTGKNTWVGRRAHEQNVHKLPLTI